MKYSQKLFWIIKDLPQNLWYLRGGGMMITSGFFGGVPNFQTKTTAQYCILNKYNADNAMTMIAWTIVTTITN
jgi:hypothetical protein